jgi:outer membrane protein assembly factor BamB
MRFPIFFASILAFAETLHWPQFRGPNGTGVGRGEAPVEIGREKNVIWKTAIPAGHSSPVVVGDLIFLTGEEGGKKSPSTRDKITTDGKLVTFCVNRKTGKILWQREVPRPRLEHYQPTNSAASPSVASDGNNIYVFFGDFGLLSYTLGGKERWRRPLGPFNNVNGHGSSPVVAGSRVYLICDQDTDSYLLALDKDSGETAWKVERPEVTRSYSTPAIYRPKAGPAELIVPGAYHIASYELETGKRLWWVRGQSWQPKSVPLIAGDTIYAHSWEYGGEAETAAETPTFEDMLKQWDKNGDRKLGKEELQDPRFARGFVNTDLDENGELSEKEWENLRARRASRNSLMAVRAGGRGDVTSTHVTWQMQKFLPNVPSPLVYQDVMYLIKDGGVLTTLDPATGKILKQGRLAGALDTYYASPIGVDGKVYLVSQQGKVTILKAGAQWEILSSADLEEEAYATPAPVEGRLYVRTRGTLYCFGAR